MDTTPTRLSWELPGGQKQTVVGTRDALSELFTVLVDAGARSVAIGPETGVQGFSRCSENPRRKG